jgi:hypothetical protein
MLPYLLLHNIHIFITTISGGCMRAYSVACAVVISLWCVSQLSAQQVGDGDQNLPPFGSFSGSDFDVVSLQNGNLHIKIPLLEVKQRAGSSGLNYIYDATSYIISHTTQIVNRQRVTSYHVSHYSGSTWNLVDSRGTWGISSTVTQITCGNQTESANQFYTVIDPELVRHPANLETSSSCVAVNTLKSPTFDGSGMMVDISQNPALITLRDGTQIRVGTSRKDSNGNIVQPTMDDLGRTLWTVTNSAQTTLSTSTGRTIVGSPSVTISTADSSGVSRVYSIQFIAIDINTTFCPQTFPPVTTCSEVGGALVVPSSLTLPTGALYQFTWFNGSAGELQQITLPTGGSISYAYKNQCLPAVNKPGADNMCRRGVTQRTVTASGATNTWNYKASATIANAIVSTDPVGNDQVHVFTTVSANNAVSANNVETEVEYFAGSESGGTLLRKVATDYTGEANPDLSNLLSNVRPIRITTTLDNGLVTKTETDYETFTFPFGTQTFTATRLNPTEKREYDYGSGAPGPLRRRTDYTYLHQGSTTYTNLNIVDRPSTVLVYDGNGNLISKTINEYDNYTAGIQASGAVQRDSSFGPAYTHRPQFHRRPS